jgi:hypothetical protein
MGQKRQVEKLEDCYARRAVKFDDLLWVTSRLLGAVEAHVDGATYARVRAEAVMALALAQLGVWGTPWATAEGHEFAT